MVPFTPHRTPEKRRSKDDPLPSTPADYLDLDNPGYQGDLVPSNHNNNRAMKPSVDEHALTKSQDMYVDMNKSKDAPTEGRGEYHYAHGYHSSSGNSASGALEANTAENRRQNSYQLFPIGKLSTCIGLNLSSTISTSYIISDIHARSR